jgi:hypothetical protein
MGYFYLEMGTQKGTEKNSKKYKYLLTMATTTPFGGSVALITLLVLITSCVKRGKKVYNRIIRIDFKNKRSNYVVLTLTL